MKTAQVKGKKPNSKIANVSNEIVEDMVKVCKSLADKSRMHILFLLAREGEMHVSKICEEIGQTQPAVSHHLTQLKNAKLVHCRRDGKFNHYSLDARLLGGIIDAFFPNAASAQQKMAFGELEIQFKAK